MDSKKIGNTTVAAREWEKNGQHRIYFTANRAQAIWDVNASEWIKTHHELSAQFKLNIKLAFDLPLSNGERSYLERIGRL